ncbi:MAG: hypothetical protein QW764_01460 [Desulfurococcaceae archaeon]
MIGERAPNTDARARVFATLLLIILILAFSMQVITGETGSTGSDEVETLTRAPRGVERPNKGEHQAYHIYINILIVSIAISLTVILLESVDWLRTRKLRHEETQNTARFSYNFL